jgi:hypothetical protein
MSTRVSSDPVDAALFLADAFTRVGDEAREEVADALETIEADASSTHEALVLAIAWRKAAVIMTALAAEVRRLRASS